MLEKNQFKFKYHQPTGKVKNSKLTGSNNKNNWSNTYYDVINGNEFSKGTSISKVNRRLSNIEGVLVKVIPSINRVLDRDNSNKVICYKRKCNSDFGSEGSDDHEGVIISHYSDLKTLNYEDYPKFMLSFYFTMQAYCSFPPVMDLEEFFQCTKTYSNSIPDYLMSAIIGHASLNSPHPRLHLQNIEYSDYYYKLSIIQMSKVLATPNIHLIQTLLILSGIDEALNRPLQKFERVTTAVKLAQVMGMDRQDELVDGYLPDRFMNVSKATVKKLWVLVKTIDWEMSKAKNCPPLVQTEDNWLLPACKPFQEQALIQRCKSSLPQEYTQLFAAFTQFANLVIPAFATIEQDLNTQPAIVKAQTCLNIVNKINKWQESLGPYAKFTIDCLNPTKISKNPQLRLRLNLYQKMIEICIKIYLYAIYYSSGLELKQVLPLVRSGLKFGKNLVSLLENYQFENLSENLSDSSNEGYSNEDKLGKSDKVGLNLDLFNILGALYMNMVQLLKTIRLKDLTELKTLTITNNMIHTAINSLIQYMSNCTQLWAHSQLITNNLINKYANLVESDEFNNNLVDNSDIPLSTCDPFSVKEIGNEESGEEVEFCFCFYSTP